MSLQNRRSKRNKRIFSSYGYILLRKSTHPMADCNGYVREHRFIMSEYLGRVLDRKEVVHHINGDKSDNRIDNLILYKDNVEHTFAHRPTRRNREYLRNYMRKWRDLNRDKLRGYKQKYKIANQLKMELQNAE